MSNSLAFASVNKIELEQYFVEHNLSEKARAYIRSSFHEPPALLVGESKGVNRPNNFIVEFSNDKTGTSERLESIEERAHAYFLNQSDSVKSYVVRPKPIELKKLDKNMVSRLTRYQPDFLELTDKGPVVIETKPEGALEDCRDLHPHNWELNQGQYRHLPIEEYFNGLGLAFKVVNTSEYSRTLIANLQLIRQVYRQGLPDISVQEKVLSLLRGEAVMSIEDILNRVGLMDVTQVIYLVDSGQLYAAIDRQPISFTSNFFISLPCNGKAVESLLERLAADNDDVSKCMDVAGPARVAKAIEKLDLVKLSLRGPATAKEKNLLKLKSRSIRRYKQKIREGKRKGLSEIQSLLDDEHKKGNRNPGRPLEVIETLRKLCLQFYASATRRHGAAAYRKYHKEAVKVHPEEQPVSYPRFLEEVSRLLVDATVQYARGGKRLANATQGPTDPMTRQLKPTRAFEKATCDHYQVDSYFLVNEANLEVEVRPWITLIRDLYTGVALAIYVDLATPSRASTAAAIRVCIRNHGRVPECMIVDRGADFESTHFTELCYELDIEIHRRPASHPKYGSEAERFFGEIRTDLLAQMKGNFVRKFESRSISGNKAPKKVALYTLRRFIELIYTYKEWRKKDYIRTDLATPELLMEDSLMRFPISGNKVQLDKRLKILTSVQAKEIKLNPIRGIKILDDHYWSSALDVKRFKASVTPVRIDPENGQVVYVFMDGAWIDCYSENRETYRYLPLAERVFQGILTRHQQRLRRKPLLNAHHKLIEEVQQVSASEPEKLSIVKPVVPDTPMSAPRKQSFKVLELKRRPS